VHDHCAFVKTALLGYGTASRRDSIVGRSDKNHLGAFADFPGTVGKTFCPDFFCRHLGRIAVPCSDTRNRVSSLGQEFSQSRTDDTASDYSNRWFQGVFP
jgi:hypothetical protein